jgi:hypothetical protein
MSVFHGNRNEDPREFITSYLQCTAANDDDFKARQFINYLGAYSDADEWFDELPQEEKNDWAAIECSFRKRWLREELSIKKIITIENEPQVSPHFPEIIQNQVFLPHKPSDTPTSSPTTSSAPTKPRTNHSLHSEPAQVTATSPQPFSPPAPSPAPKPLEIGSLQPVSLHQHFEMGSPACVATSHSLALARNGKNTKISENHCENSPYNTVFSSLTPPVTPSDPTAPSTATTALETRSTMAGFIQKLEILEIPPISTHTTPQTLVPSPLGPTDDVMRVCTSPPAL